jgi:hypothetical protein
VKAISALLPLVVTLLSGCLAPRPEWADGAEVRTVRTRAADPQDLSNISARILATHNRERVTLRAPALSWDPMLAASAAAYAPRLAELPRLAHSPREARIGQGENLWRGTSGAFTLEEILGTWAGERRLFRPGTFPEVSQTGQWSDVAHYSQMIWPSTNRIGCAFHRSQGWDYLICRYAPAGNVTGQRIP